MTHFRYLSHFIPKILLFERRKFFSYILALRGNFGTIRKGPPLLTLFGLAYFVVSGI